MLKTIATCFGAMLISATAFGQNSVGTVELQQQETPKMKWNTIEVKPGELLLAAIPGFASAGATFETKITPNWAAVVGGSYYDAKISGNTIDRVRKDTDAPLPKSGYGYSTGLGARYYEDPIGDSIYAGGQLDYAEGRINWDYENTRYRSNVYGVTPSLALGYRWVWQNGLVFRLGAGAGMPKIDSLKIRELAQASSRGSEKIEDILDQRITPKIDLGLGFTF